MSQKLFTFILILVVSVSVFGQTPTPDVNAGDNDKTRKEYVDFLRETMADVANLRSLGNRISFSAELASLMWYYDEREARAMYLACIADFKDLIGQYDMQMKSTVSTGENDTEYSYGGMLADMPERTRITRKFSSAMMVRQQIAMSIAEHDPDLAFSFYNESGQIASSPELRKMTEDQESWFEYQLVGQIAENDPEKAAKYGKSLFTKSVSYQDVGLLKKIYTKNADKGAEFAQSLLIRARNQKYDANNFDSLGDLLTAGVENYKTAQASPGTKPMFTEQDLRDLSEQLARTILDSDSSAGLAYVDTIAKFAPSRAVQIRTKFQSENGNSKSVRYGTNSAVVTTEIANNMQQQKQRQEESEKIAKQLADDVQSIGNKDLPKEERQKMVDRARAIIVGTPGRDKKIAALGMLAASVAKAGDKELAASIMKDAQALVNPDPRNAQDFLLMWMLAGAYAESDPDKAFPLLQDTISRLNETIAAFIKVGEFIDTAGEIMQDDEVQVGMFGGSMIRSMTSNLGVAEGTIRTLAKVDFGKTRNLTNSFDRPEVRILAKMLVLRAILTKPEKKMEATLEPTLDY